LNAGDIIRVVVVNNGNNCQSPGTNGIGDRLTLPVFSGGDIGVQVQAIDDATGAP